MLLRLLYAIGFGLLVWLIVSFFKAGGVAVLLGVLCGALYFAMAADPTA